MNSTDSKPKSKAEREAEEKARRRAEAAMIVAGLKQAIDTDEQLLGFARGRLAGGIRGKLSLGPEAFFAPFVNIGLTERRLVIQHINAETGRPGEILPHFYALGDIAALGFSDIETFGGESAARLTVRLRNEQHMRLRLRGQSNLESAQAIVEVFRSLTSAQRPMTTPTQRVCATCQHIMDQPFKFCPYCGQQQDLTASTSSPMPMATEETERTYPLTPPGATEPEFLDTLPYQDASVFRGPTVEDGLDFLTPVPVVPATTPVSDPEPVAPSEPEAEPSASPELEPISDVEAVAAPDPEAVSTLSPAEDTAFETPSTFEGWSVDPGASAAVVEPSEAVEAVPTQGFPAEASFLSDPVLDSKASVVEADPAAEVPITAFPRPTALEENQTDVSSVWVAPATAVHPEAEFASIPEPAAFTPEEAPLTESFEAPPTAESFSEASPPAAEHGDFVVSEPGAVAPALEGAGFVMEPVALEAPTPFAEKFEPFAPVILPSSEPEAVAAPEFAEPTVPAVAPDPAPVAAVAAEVPSAAPEPTPAPTSSPSEDRFAALLKEIRGADAPTPPPVVERRDGPMSVKVHINRPPITVNEAFQGQNADEVVGKLKARVLPELNFAARLMLSSFSNLRFAQEIVSRYNAKEKTNYPAPNSCWEFLQNAEEMGYATIQLNS